MDVFITGVTGYIGRAVAEAIHSAGHTVWALVRSAEAVAKVGSRGWKPVPGDLRETRELERIVESVDAVVHVGNTGLHDAAHVDREATRAILRGLRGSGKSFLYTSGAWVLGAGISDEGAPLAPPALVAWRASLEGEVLRAAPGARTVVVRPGIVYGRGGGIFGMIVRGEVPIVGSGAQRWPMVHVDDLADLYVRALDAPAGAILHGVTDSLTMQELALMGASVDERLAPEALSIEELLAGSYAQAGQPSLVG